mmetsp:Transcript_105686/g.329370  ORF Transcript_105686/g.329370 Transcript_105686/m.329370 type:complete len:508 (-) Transcript_105686:22-1545(-)
MQPGVVRRVWRDATILLLLGVTVGLPTTVLPALQAAAFVQPFAIAGVAVGVKGFLSTVLAPAAGARADRTGRRKRLLLGALAVLLLPFAAAEVVSQSLGRPDAPGVIWSFTVVDALFGLSSVAMSLCFAAVPDRLGGDEASLTTGYSICNFALSTGIGMGAVMGAFGDFLACSRCGLLVAGANLLAATMLIPRGVAPTARQQPEAGLGLRRDALALLRGNRTLALLAAVVFLDFLAEQMLVSLLLLYLESQFHVSSLQLGCQLMVIGLTASLSLLVVVPWLQPLIGDLRLMQVGMVANIISVGLFAFVQRSWQAFIPPLGCILSFAVFPTANSLASAAVPRSQGGMAQGIVSGARTLAEGLSPVIFGWLFQLATRSALPGWPFLVAAGCVAVALAVSLPISKPRSPGASECEAAGGGCSGGALLGRTAQGPPAGERRLRGGFTGMAFVPGRKLQRTVRWQHGSLFAPLLFRWGAAGGAARGAAPPPPALGRRLATPLAARAVPWAAA